MYMNGDVDGTSGPPHMPQGLIDNQPTTKESLMKRTLITGGVLFLALIGARHAHAELQLRSIMGDLGQRMELVTRGVYTADFEMIEKNALLIADHEKPPMTERMKILGFLKSGAAGFKAGDGIVHDEAAKLAEAARGKDMDGVLFSYSGVMAGCVNCHTNFRDKIVGHFYEENK